MSHTYSPFSSLFLRRAALVISSMSLAFFLGTQTAGEHPIIGSTQAVATVLAGDFNGDGKVDAVDARIALEIAQGLRAPTAQELRADTDGDGQITSQDALFILDNLSH